MERAALRISKPSDTGCNFFQCLFALQKKKEREKRKKLSLVAIHQAS